MPVILFWTAPAVIAAGLTGYYLIAMSAALDLATVDLPSARRRQFRVIQGGKAV